MFCKRVRLFYTAGPRRVPGSGSRCALGASPALGLFLGTLGRQERLPVPAVRPSVRPSAPRAEEPGPAGPVPVAVAPCTCAFKCTFSKGLESPFPGSGRGGEGGGAGLGLALPSAARRLFFLPVYRDQ